MHPLARPVAALLGRAPAALALTPRPPAPHQTNRLYDVRAGDRHWLAKEFVDPAVGADCARREARALAHVASLDVAPRLAGTLPAAAGVHGPLVVYEFLPGVMWDRRRPAPARLAQLAATWLALNALPADGAPAARSFEGQLDSRLARAEDTFARYAEWSRAAFPPARRAAALCAEALARGQPLARELAARRPPLAFCRSDPRFANVILRPGGRLGLVDWEDSGLRDPAAEVADLLVHANQEDLLAPAEWRAFLDPYFAGRAPDDPDLIERARLYLGLFPLLWLALFVELGLRRAAAGALAGWEANALPANLRLRRYLARVRAWPARDVAGELAVLDGVAFFPER